MRSASSAPVCTHCGSTKSPLWRRGARQEVLCNACGLYWKHHGTYRPLSLKAAADKKVELFGPLASDSGLAVSGGTGDANGPRSTRPASSTKSSQHSSSISKALHAHANANRFVRSLPMRTANILLAPGQYGYSMAAAAHPPTATETASVILPPLRGRSSSLDSFDSDQNRPDPDPDATLQGTVSEKAKDWTHADPMAGRRQICAAPVLPNLRSVLDQINGSGPEPGSKALQARRHGAFPNPLAIKFIIHNGLTMYQGDHVAVRGDDEQIYFAILQDFWLTESGRRYCTLRWLLPRAPSALFNLTQLRPDAFTFGPAHERVESMDVLVDVFYSPYKANIAVDLIRKYYLRDDRSSAQTPAASLPAVNPPLEVTKSMGQSRSTFDFLLAKQASNEEIPLNQIEGTEIAAKMLLHMI